MTGWRGPLLWCDLETTGLDHKHDLILEAGLVITNGHDYRIQSSVSDVVGYPDIRSRVRNEFVQKMHEESGLFCLVERGKLTLRDLEQKLIAWCEENDAKKLCMAGSGVADFERRFLKEHMPDLMSFAFNHQFMDMLTIRRFFGIPRIAGPHRVMGDLERDIKMVRGLQGRLAATA